MFILVTVPCGLLLLLLLPFLDLVLLLPAVHITGTAFEGRTTSLLPLMLLLLLLLLVAAAALVPGLPDLGVSSSPLLTGL